MDKCLLKLYVIGQTARSVRAVANARRIAAEAFDGDCELVIVDIVERPELAEEEKILATPMLVRHLPPPTRRMIGDLSDTQKVLACLDLSPDSQNGRGK